VRYFTFVDWYQHFATVFILFVGFEHVAGFGKIFQR